MSLLPTFRTGTHFDVRTDASVLAFAAGTAAATALLVGLLPALVASRAHPAAGLRNPRIVDIPRLRLGRLLVFTQVAMSVVLLTGAGLMARTVANLRHVELGFVPDRLMVFRLNAAQGGVPESQLATQYDGCAKRSPRSPG